jgi:hypothetical protein
MFNDNPFIPVTDFLPAGFLQVYVALMLVAVIAGTIYDLYHKRSAQFFAQQRAQSRAAATRTLSSSDMVCIATRTLAHDVATFGEFCNPSRRLSHVLMFYGFVLYLVTTIIMVYAYPMDPHTPAVLPALWNIGALMVLIGGYWFFFFLRVNVVHDGQPPWRLVRADLFIVTLLSSVSFALLFELVAMTENPTATRIFFSAYLFFSTLLFVSVPWSKFAHMFYKPVVAFQRQIEEEDGSSTLPSPTTTGGKQCPPSPT